MEKEKVTEELVRQNGNQAAAVMADYAGQGGGGGGGGSTSRGKVVYGGLVDLLDLPCFKPSGEWPEEEQLRLIDILADGYALINWTSETALALEGGFYVVRVTGSNPSVQLIDGEPVFTDCEAIILDLPNWVAFHFEYIQAIHTVVLDDISGNDPLCVFDTITKDDLPPLGHLDEFTNAPLLIGEVFDGTDYRVCIHTSVIKSKPGSAA